MDEITVTKGILSRPIDSRVQAIVGIAGALRLSDVITIDYHLAKAHAGERITSPHLIPEIWELEKEFHGLWDAKKIIKSVLTSIGVTDIPEMSKAITSPNDKIYKMDGKPLTDKERRKLEDAIMKALHIPRAKVQEIIIKAYATAKLTKADFMGQPLVIDLSMLPKSLKDAIKKGVFTAREVQSIKFAFEYAAENVTAVTMRAKTEIKNMILEGIQNHTPPRTLANRMYNELAINDKSVLNRDWERIAITETNRAANDGIIAQHNDGDYVVGDSHNGACPYCLRYINNKVYKVTTRPPEYYGNYDPKSEKYRKLAQRWDTEIWVGKSNVGRSLSARKQLGGKLFPREHHELACPTLPLHPQCRCRWSTWIPEIYYIKNGQIEFAVDDDSKKEHAEFLKRNPHIKVAK